MKEGAQTNIHIHSCLYLSTKRFSAHRHSHTPALARTQTNTLPHHTQPWIEQREEGQKEDDVTSVDSLAEA